MQNNILRSFGLICLLCIIVYDNITNEFYDIDDNVYFLEEQTKNILKTDGVNLRHLASREQKDYNVNIAHSPIILKIFFEGSKCFDNNKLQSIIWLRPNRMLTQVKIEKSLVNLKKLYKESMCLVKDIGYKIIKKENNQVDFIFKIYVVRDYQLLFSVVGLLQIFGLIFVSYYHYNYSSYDESCSSVFQMLASMDYYIMQILFGNDLKWGVYFLFIFGVVLIVLSTLFGLWMGIEFLILK